MSSTKSVTIHCDACGEWTDGGTHWVTVKQARLALRGSHWHRVGPNRDICPTCWAEGKRGPDIAPWVLTGADREERNGDG